MYSEWKNVRVGRPILEHELRVIRICKRGECGEEEDQPHMPSPGALPTKRHTLSTQATKTLTAGAISRGALVGALSLFTAAFAFLPDARCLAALMMVVTVKTRAPGARPETRRVSITCVEIEYT